MQIFSGRRHRVDSIVFSRCGRWLAAGGFGGSHLWDTANPTATPKQLQASGNLAFRPNGELFYRSGLDELCLADPEKFEPRSLGQQPGMILMTPDGDYFLVVGRLSVVVSMRLNTKGKFVKKSHRIAKPATGIYPAAFSPDGITLATVEGVHGGPDPLLILRSADKLKKFDETTTYREPLQLLFSPDGATIFVRAAASVACYDANDLKRPPRKIVNPSRKHFVSMDVHPDGKLLTVDNDAHVRVWDIATLTQVRTVEWKIGGLYAVAVSPDGTRAATGGSRGKVLVWDWD